MNGIKQGICVGLGSIVLLVGIQMGNPKVTVEILLVNVASVFILTMVGGWFGAQLLPPLVKRRRRLSDPGMAGRVRDHGGGDGRRLARRRGRPGVGDRDPPQWHPGRGGCHR